MNIENTLEQIRQIAKQEADAGNTTESNSRLENGELLWAALALLGHGYTQIRGTVATEGNPADFWPFGPFIPSESAKENLMRACQMIIFEIDRLENGVQVNTAKE